MKPIILLTLLFLHCLLLNAQDSWEKIANLPDSRAEAVGFSVGGYGYIGTGGSSSGMDNMFYRYDPQRNVWERYTIMPGLNRRQAFCFVINGLIYIGGGVNSYQLYDFGFWEYNPISNVWTQKNDIPFTTSSDWTVTFSIDSLGYLKKVGGSQYGNFVHYDPTTDQWKKLAQFPGSGIMGECGFSLNGKGYIGLGFNGYTDNLTEFWEYLPKSNRWIRKNDFAGHKRSDAVAFTIDGVGYIGSGIEKLIINISTDFWAYSQEDDTWSRIADCSLKTTLGCAFSLDGKGYFGTGLDSDGNEIWAYTPLYSKVKNEVLNYELSVFPNPAKDYLYIRTSIPNIKSIEIYSSSGYIIQKHEYQQSEISLQNLSSGIYYLVLLFDGGKETTRFLVL